MPKPIWVALGGALYAAAGTELRDVGVNFNLAPVADLDDPENPIIGRYGRAFSADPAIVAQYAAAAIAGFASSGILTAVKHFPGHGHSLGDTHEGFVDITDTFQLAAKPGCGTPSASTAVRPS